MKPSGISGNDSPPSRRELGREIDGEVGAFDEVLLLGEEVVQNVRERQVGGAEAGGEEIPQGAGDLVGYDRGDHEVIVWVWRLGVVGDGGIDWCGKRR